MRRRDKEIGNNKEINTILANEKVCRIAMNDEKYPYIVPVLYTFMNNKIFIHSAHHGKKIELISNNPNVSFEIDILEGIKGGTSPCSFSAQYLSVIGTGQARIIADEKIKDFALKSIVEKYTSLSVDREKKLGYEMVTVIEITIDSVTGKKSV
jgi:nitroimidazol reductase NimA-like FMN-containing flavoprotein (pyridoxamine 5'-phosphate oxidase superfamily)